MIPGAACLLLYESSRRTEDNSHSGGTHALDDRHHPAHPLAPRCLRGKHWWNSPPSPGDRAHRDRLPSRDGSETGGLTPSNAQKKGGRIGRPFFILQFAAWATVC